jgi:hypothetical protein
MLGSNKFLYTLKADPAGGRLRRPSSRRQRHDGKRGTAPALQCRQRLRAGAPGDPEGPPTGSGPANQPLRVPTGLTTHGQGLPARGVTFRL